MTLRSNVLIGALSSVVFQELVGLCRWAVVVRNSDIAPCSLSAISRSTEVAGVEAEQISWIRPWDDSQRFKTAPEDRIHHIIEIQIITRGIVIERTESRMNLIGPYLRDHSAYYAVNIK